MMKARTKYVVGGNVTLIINFEYTPYEYKSDSGPEVDIKCIYIEGHADFFEDDIQSHLNQTTLDCIEVECFEAIDRIKKHQAPNSKAL